MIEFDHEQTYGIKSIAIKKNTKIDVSTYFIIKDVNVCKTFFNELCL